LLSSGNSDVPNSTRKHSITDAFGIVGVRNNLNKLSDYPNDKIRIKYKEPHLK
jgi:hypothetical protein